MRIAFGYALIIITTSIGGFYGVFTLQKSRAVDREVTDYYLPMVDKLEKLNLMMNTSRKLVNNWVFSPDPDEKEELRMIHANGFLLIKSDLMKIGSGELGDSLIIQLSLVEENIRFQRKIMNMLNSYEDYDNDEIVFAVLPILENNVTPGLHKIAEWSNLKAEKLQANADLLIQEKYRSFNSVQTVIMSLTTFSILLGILWSVFSIKSILNPIKKLSDLISRMAKGELPEWNVTSASDEIGDITRQLQELRNGLVSTTSFAMEIRSGNLEADYKLLSNEDALGKSLIAMRENLKKVISETNAIVSLVAEEGRLNSRLELEDKTGAWADLSRSINQLFNSISNPVEEIQSILVAMAEGDLTKRYQKEARGEILKLAENLNYALDALNSLLHDINETATVFDDSTMEMQTSGEEMSTSTGEIASAISQMSNGAQSQVAKVDESSQLVEDIRSSSQNMAERTDAINQAAKKGVLDSERGSKMIQNVSSSIGEISEFSSMTNESMRVLTERSVEIERMLNVITEIASQTNLLALNAAIEAAQAGEAGRGFAVVAEEIRKLAEDSRNSAKEIEKLINDVSTDTSKTAEMMQKMNASVTRGVGASQEAAEVFSDMSASSNKTLGYSEKILEATTDQSEKIKNVVNITESIVVIAEQTSAGTEEIASSATQLSTGMVNYIEKSQRLNDISQKLKKGLSKFRLNEQSEINLRDIISTD